MWFGLDGNELRRRCILRPWMTGWASQRTTVAAAFQVVLQEVRVAIRLLRRHSYLGGHGYKDVVVDQNSRHI